MEGCDEMREKKKIWFLLFLLWSGAQLQKIVTIMVELMESIHQSLERI
jgi:hypothetical protein